MKHKMYVEEYIPSVNKYGELVDYPTVEPTELNENIQPMTPSLPPTPMPTVILYNPSSCPTQSILYSPRPSSSGVYSDAPFYYVDKPVSPVNIPAINNTNTTFYPTYETYTPTCIITYSPSEDKYVNYTTSYSYSAYKNNIITFGIATGLGSLCFLILFAYIYKIYVSKKYKLQKIQKNALKRQYMSLNDIHIADYNSQF